jgi:hypothetical protein
MLKDAFFFHDEWTWLRQIIISPRDFLFEPFNQHFTPLFNLLYLGIYRLFGLYYPAYQLILMFFHFVNGYILYLIVGRLTKNRGLGVLSFFLFMVNSVYWEVLFSSATLNTVFCLLLIALSILFYLQYQKEQERKYLLFSSLFSLLSGYARGEGLFLPLLFLMTVSIKKISRERIKIEEFLAYLVASAISIGSYLMFAGIPPTSGVDFKKVIVFALTGMKWMILSFYTASPGWLTLFVIIATFFFFVFYAVFKNKKTRKKCFKLISKNKYMLCFSSASFIYIYVLLAISRYQIDMNLAKSSRYTYIPLFFLVIINTVFLQALLPYFSRLAKLVLISYFVLLSVNHLYFFRIYYRGWVERISGPNKRIFKEITQVNSEKELEKINLPSTFHSFFQAKEIYFIYQHSLSRKETTFLNYN